MTLLLTLARDGEWHVVSHEDREVARRRDQGRAIAAAVDEIKPNVARMLREFAEVRIEIVGGG